MLRTTELRADRVELDETARQWVADSLLNDGALNLVGNRRETGDAAEYADKEPSQRAINPLSVDNDVIFLEIEVVDPSGFSDVLRVRGVDVDGHRVLRAAGPAVPNAIAAVVLPSATPPGSARTARPVDRGQPDRPPAPLPAAGPRRHAARRARDPPRERADPERRPVVHVGG